MFSKKLLSIVVLTSRYSAPVASLSKKKVLSATVNWISQPIQAEFAAREKLCIQKMKTDLLLDQYTDRLRFDRKRIK